MDDIRTSEDLDLAGGNESLTIYNLSQNWGHHMPEWPSTPGVNVHVRKFHA